MIIMVHHKHRPQRRKTRSEAKIIDCNVEIFDDEDDHDDSFVTYSSRSSTKPARIYWETKN
jgi:hypothetical protein